MSKPWLSVVMPTYNGAAFLEAALESIRAQQDPEIEILAIDDGSTDGTLRILERFAARMPLEILAKPHLGNWVARSNEGLTRARGEYLCFLHQDDLWLPGRLSALKQLVHKAPRVRMVLHPAWFIDRHGRRLALWRCPLPVMTELESRLVVERLLVQNFLAMPAPLVAREAALEVGGLDESLWYTADWDFWLKLAAGGRILYCPTPLAAFRVHNSSQTVSGVDRAAEMRRQIVYVLERHLPRWQTRQRVWDEVSRTARVAVEVNYTLALLARRQSPPWLSLACKLLWLGPSGWNRLLRDSRLLERVGARLRASW